MAKSKRQREDSSWPRRELATWPVVVVLTATIWLVYGRSLSAPWIFDDSLSVLQNRSITALWPLVGDAENPGPLRPPIENPTSARPLVNLSLAANFRFGKFDPRGYRVVNIWLHVINSLLLYAIVWRTLRLPYFGDKFENSARRLALIVSLLWALHPLVSEAVVYVTQRTELMVALCYLATLYASLRYWTAESDARRWCWLLLATAACVAGAASKEVIVSAPLLVLLFDWIFVSRSWRDVWRRHRPLYAGLATSWLLLAALQSGSPRSESAGFGLGVPLVAWWCTQAKFFVMYVKLVLWPAPLMIHYEAPQLETPGTAWAAVAAVGVVVLATLWLIVRQQPAGWPLAAVLAILAPTHVIPITTEIAAERRMYLPLAALVALVVVGVYWTVRRLVPAGGGRKQLSALGSLAILVAIVYGFATANRVETFRDPILLWRQNVELQPYNHVAQLNLASAMSVAGAQQEALPHYRAAVEAKPDFVEGRYQLGMALARAGRLDEAIVELQEVVRSEPDAYKLRNNLGVVLFTAGRFPAAIAEFEKVLELQPDFVEARENLNRARQASVLPKKAE